MQLEDGKSYIMRNGGKTGPVKLMRDSLPDLYFMGRGDAITTDHGPVVFPMWTPEGRWDAFIGFENDPAFDIVAEEGED